MTALPLIIQGGMGAGVSNWHLAKTISQLGQLGVVSGTGLAITLARRLQLGDLDGAMRRAMAHFPVRKVVEHILQQHFIPGGKSPQAPFKLTAMPSMDPGPSLTGLTVLANFVEVFLAKEGHDHPVGINYLEKIQFPTLPSLFGAMLAGIDYVLMGAGIPRTIPGILDSLATGQPVRLRLDVEECPPEFEFACEFDPARFMEGAAVHLKRPQFLAIISSATLAQMLLRKATGRVDGFIIEGPTAGGHNAPPRGPLQLNPQGEPVYGPRDVPDLEKIHELGLPFWLAGSYAEPAKIAEARAARAAGVQIGTAFAFCEESGIDPILKQRVVDQCLEGGGGVFTDPLASPTGFPFKVLELPDTISDPFLYAQRQRICDIGYLRHPYRKADGSLGYRCPAEPVAEYLDKGGAEADTVGRKCICNGLFSTIGVGQVLPDLSIEKAMVTSGDDVRYLARFLKPGQRSYTAADVLAYLLRAD